MKKVIVLLFLFCCMVPVFAVDQKDAVSFLDKKMNEYLEEGKFCGATLSIVKDGQIIFSSGYGYADLSGNKLVDPEKTLFRIGSISKIFTATAIMQLVEQEKLDLHRDVREYIDYIIPSPYDKPITLHHLLTHTAGFEDLSYELWAVDDQSVLSLEKWMKTHIPSVVTKPGTVTSYSNYGMALAGYIIERVSGLSYEEYIQKNIFDVLNMNHSTVYQNSILDNYDVSHGYSILDGQFHEENFEIVQTFPTGGISSSATDMASFMNAHLDKYNTSLFSRDTAHMMHSTQFTYREGMNGIAYGFLEKDQNGVDILNHNGDLVYMHSKMTFLMEENMGIFVNVNSAEAGMVPSDLINSFLTDFFPLPVISESDHNFDGHAGEVAGRYQSSRRAYSSAESINVLLENFVIEMIDEYTFATKHTEYVEIEPYLFKVKGGDNQILFEKNGKGEIVRGILGNSPEGILIKAPLWESPNLHFPLILFSMLTMIISALAFPVTALIKMIKKNSEKSLYMRIHRWIFYLVSILSSFFALLIVITAINPLAVLYGTVPLSSLWPFLNAFVILLISVFTIMTTFIVIRRNSSVLYRVFSLFLSTAGLVLIFLVQFWHLTIF